MFYQEKNILKWNPEFLLNNIGFQLDQIIYQRTDQYVILFNTTYHNGGYVPNIYHFIANGWTLEVEETVWHCYFCGFICSTARRINSPQENCNNYLCYDCVDEWNELRDIFIKKEHIYINNDLTIKRFIPNAIHTIKDIYNSISYDRIVIPINKILYQNVCKFIKDEHDCNFCYFTNDRYEEDDIICSKCLNYSKQIFIDAHYLQYMNIVYSQILDDSLSIIIKYYVDLIILQHP